jgi:hypothetical protein
VHLILFLVFHTKFSYSSFFSFNRFSFYNDNLSTCVINQTRVVGLHIHVPSYNTPASSGQGYLLRTYTWQLCKISRPDPHTKTVLFCALCPHFCAFGKEFPVGLWSTNHCMPGTLNLRVLRIWDSRKEVGTCWYEYPINPINPWAWMLHQPS